MSNVSDETSQQLMHEAERKLAEKSADLASDAVSAVSGKFRSNDFSMISNGQEQPIFHEYFSEGERREVFGEISRQVNGTAPDFTKYDSLAKRAQPKINKLEHESRLNNQKLEELRAENKKLLEEIPRKKGRLSHEKGRSRIDDTGRTTRTSGRLTFKDRDNGRMTEREYYHKLHKTDIKERRAERRADRMKERGRLLFDDENIEKDEDFEAVSGRLKTAKKGARLVVRENARKIRRTSNAYTRLQHGVAKENARLQHGYDLQRKKNTEQDRVLKKSAQSAEMKKKLKKEIVRRKAMEQNNTAFRMKNFLFGKKKSRAVQRMAMKRNLTLITSVSSIVCVVVVLLIMMFMMALLFMNMVAEIGVRSTTSNTYTDISDATSQFRKLEVDLEEFLNPETLEPILQEENPDKEIYEYIYDLDEFGFSPNTLIAYLSVKYQEFDLQEVAEEIEKIFDEMYYFHYELVQEPRYLKVGSHTDPETGEEIDDYDWVDVWICYVFLEKTEMETVVESKMTAEELEQYKIYKLSHGGQQVYGGVMLEDWTNLVSSPFGERIHPITGERTFHNGVDIAIPTGTKLYTPVEGTVTTARYSDTAGNYLIITTEDGWSVKLMHMDSLAVSAGDKIERGDFVGYSGNTGRSTGPHLHLEVRNPSDLPIDPVFIVPQRVKAQTD